jgi:hypothetical protein
MKLNKLERASFTIAACIVFFTILNFGCTRNNEEVIVWNVPGGELLMSPDYELTIKRGAKSWKPSTFYTTAKGVDKIIDHEQEG